MITAEGDEMIRSGLKTRASKVSLDYRNSMISYFIHTSAGSGLCWTSFASTDFRRSNVSWRRGGRR